MRIERSKRHNFSANASARNKSNHSPFLEANKLHMRYFWRNYTGITCREKWHYRLRDFRESLRHSIRTYSPHDANVCWSISINALKRGSRDDCQLLQSFAWHRNYLLSQLIKPARFGLCESSIRATAFLRLFTEIYLWPRHKRFMPLTWVNCRIFITCLQQSFVIFYEIRDSIAKSFFFL